MYSCPNLEIWYFSALYLAGAYFLILDLLWPSLLPHIAYPGIVYASLELVPLLMSWFLLLVSKGTGDPASSLWVRGTPGRLQGADPLCAECEGVQSYDWMLPDDPCFLTLAVCISTFLPWQPVLWSTKKPQQTFQFVACSASFHQFRCADVLPYCKSWDLWPIALPFYVFFCVLNFVFIPLLAFKYIFMSRRKLINLSPVTFNYIIEPSKYKIMF